MRVANAALPIALCTLMASGCNSFRSASSPDVVYDDNAESARTLQIPPDLTDVSNTEQFVLPGNTGGQVSRNTLLPSFSAVSFERNGQQSWLAFDNTPEELWPQLLAFARKERFRIEQTEPVAGVIATQWRPASAVAKGSLLQNLIGGDEAYSRVLFRLERQGNGARLFARSQAASESVALSPDADAAPWPASSHDPEATSALLSRLLVFLGVEGQKARGILDADQAQLITDDAVVLTSGSGSQLIVNRGFQPSFNAILAALDSLDYAVTSSDDGVGRIEFLEKDVPLVLEMTPEHVSEVRVALTDTTGRRLEESQEQAVLNAILAKLV